MIKRQNDTIEVNPPYIVTILHSEWPKLYANLAFLSVIGLKTESAKNKI